MKRAILASTALVMSAGIAAAEVSVTGDGRLAVRSMETVNDGELTFDSRMRIKFAAYGESDN